MVSTLPLRFFFREQLPVNVTSLTSLLRGPESCAKETTERFQSGAGADVCFVQAVRAAGSF